MNPQHIFKAIEKLAPGAEITFTETDLDSLVWYSPHIEQPSKEAILAEVKKIIAEEPLKAKIEAEAKEALLAKLGITVEESRLLLS